jgi:hypothetical protein
MTEDPTTRDPGGAAEWLLTREEIRSLRSTRRHFLLGLIVATALTLGAIGLTAWSTTRHPPHPLELAAPVLGLVPAAAAAIWFAGRAQIVGQDIRTGRAEVQWGRVTRLWTRLRVVEVEGLLFPLQVTPVPTVRPGAGAAALRPAVPDHPGNPDAPRGGGGRAAGGATPVSRCTGGAGGRFPVSLRRLGPTESLERDLRKWMRLGT